MKTPAAKAAVDKEWEILEKISAWNLTKVRSQKEVIDEARMKGAKVHFASLMDICHLKNAELETKHQKNKGRVVLRGDIVKDDPGSYAVFTEQGSSASQMAAAKVKDIIPRPSGCAGQAADAVSAETQVKMEDWIRLPRHKWPKSWSSMEDPVVPLERNLYGQFLAGLLWERQFENILLKHGWEKDSKLGMLIRTQWKRIILICVCGWHKIGPKETKSWSDVETTQQRSRFGRTNIFPWSCILGMHSETVWKKQRYCGQLQSYVWISNFRAWNWKNFHTLRICVSQNFCFSSWSYDMEGSCTRNVWNDVVRWQTGRLNNFYKVSTPCIDDHHFQERRIEICRENCHKLCSQMVLEMLVYLARIGRPDNLWSVNKLARSITKWTKACDKRLNRLISNIHHTCEYKQYCYVGYTTQTMQAGTVSRLRYCRRS